MSPPFCLTKRTQCKASWQCTQLKETTVSLLYMNLQIVNLTKMRMCVPSMSGRSETEACAVSPVASDPSVLPSPTSSPSSSKELFLPVHLMSAVELYYYYTLQVLCDFKCLFFVCFVYVLLVQKVL